MAISITSKYEYEHHYSSMPWSNDHFNTEKTTMIIPDNAQLHTHTNYTVFSVIRPKQDAWIHIFVNESQDQNVF